MIKPFVTTVKTMADFYNFCRDVCSISKVLLENPFHFGGEGNVVEIDETKLGGKRKYGRGRLYSGLDMWIFTLYDRATKNVGFIIVKDRKKETLHALIQATVLPGTTIYSDQWASYKGLDQLGYVHKTVNHSEEFVSEDGIHINSLEHIHGELKAELKIIRGIRINFLKLYDIFICSTLEITH